MKTRQHNQEQQFNNKHVSPNHVHTENIGAYSEVVLKAKQPGLISSSDIAMVQRTLGNQATKRLISSMLVQQGYSPFANGKTQIDHHESNSVYHNEIQRKPITQSSSPKKATLNDVQQLLRQLPVETAEGAQLTKEILSAAIQVRDEVIDETIPVASLVLNVDDLIESLKEGKFGAAAKALVDVIGDTANTFAWLLTAADTMGIAAASATGGLTGAAQAGVILRGVGRAAPLAAVALGTLIEVFSMPSDVNKNMWKIFYIAGVSGVLTSWVFNDKSISPYAQLMSEARKGGYAGTDIRDSVTTAHQKAHEYWQSQYSGHPDRVKSVQQAMRGDYRAYWRLLGGQLESALKPQPDGMGLSNINRLINGVQLVHKERDRERKRQENIERYGGILKMSDGSEMVIPPS